MSQENIEIVRRFYRAWARDEFPGPIALMDPEIEYVNPAGAVEPGTRRGRSAFSAAVEKTLEGWETWEIEPEQFTAVGDQVAAVVRYRARGRGSGIEVSGASRPCGPSVTARSGATPGFTNPRTPSKPPGCRSNAERGARRAHLPPSRSSWPTRSRFPSGWSRPRWKKTISQLIASPWTRGGRSSSASRIVELTERRSSCACAFNASARSGLTTSGVRRRCPSWL